MERIKKTIREAAQLCSECRISQAAAALSHYLTLSIFPTLLCIYVMLGKWFPDAESLPFLHHVLPESTIETILSYLSYIAANSGDAMLIAGISLMVTTSAGAFRSLYGTLARVHGETRRRFRSLFSLVISFFVSPVALGGIYLFALLTAGQRWLVETASEWFGMQELWIQISSLRFLLMLAVFPLALAWLYHITAPRQKDYPVFPGAIGASLSLVGVSYVFSHIIYLSTRYPMVYGSLASIMILMIWLQLCATIVICGAVLNQLINRRRVRRTAQPEAEEEEAGQDPDAQTNEKKGEN